MSFGLPSHKSIHGEIYMLANEKDTLIEKSTQIVKNVAIPAAFIKRLEQLTLQDLSRDLQVKLKRAGSQTYRSDAEAAMMLQKVSAPFRTSLEDVERYLRGKDASHIVSRANGGSDHSSNLIWEIASKNRARGRNNMSTLERAAIISQDFAGNLNLAAIKGLKAAPVAAVIAALAAMPITFLKYSFLVARGEMTKEEATKSAVRDILKRVLLVVPQPH
jgi:hypothetical protein